LLAKTAKEATLRLRLLLIGVREQAIPKACFLLWRLLLLLSLLSKKAAASSIAEQR